jgi:NADH-quinone oxidoreductase subunit J
MILHILSALMVVAALLVVFSRRPLNSALWLVACLVLQAALFAAMGAHLVAVLQVLLYAGAVMVFILFVIMLLGLGPPVPWARAFSGKRVVAGVAAFYLAAVLGLALWLVYKKGMTGDAAASGADGTVESVAEILLTGYRVPFELTAALLLIAVVAAITMARGGKRT